MITAAAGLLLTAALAAQSDETLRIMPFTRDASPCVKCHSDGSRDERLKTPAQACSHHCLSCHKEMARHHTVGTVVEGEGSPGIHLTQKNELACVTCHDLTVPRYDDKPWRAESLFGSMFRRQSQYKTYYLVVRNNKGQLCRNCH